MYDAGISDPGQHNVWLAWENRGRRNGTAIEGVMIKSFPRVVNRILHAWQLDALLGFIPQGVDLQMLDIGCGYGRISHAVVDARPQVQAVGMDVAHVYAHQFACNGHGCRAIQAGIPQMPFGDASFDLVVAVGVLGYMSTPALQRWALEEMLRVLKPQGRCILITEEPGGRQLWSLGGSLQALGRLVGPGKGAENRGHVPLPLPMLRDGILRAGGRIIQQSGCPVLTACLPALVAMALVRPDAVPPMADACLWFDRHWGSPPSPSIYTVTTVAKGT